MTWASCARTPRTSGRFGCSSRERTCAVLLAIVVLRVLAATRILRHGPPSEQGFCARGPDRTTRAVRDHPGEPCARLEAVLLHVPAGDDRPGLLQVLEGPVGRQGPQVRPGRRRAPARPEATASSCAPVAGHTSLPRYWASRDRRSTSCSVMPSGTPPCREPSADRSTSGWSSPDGSADFQSSAWVSRPAWHEPPDLVLQGVVHAGAVLVAASFHGPQVPPRAARTRPRAAPAHRPRRRTRGR